MMGYLVLKIQILSSPLVEAWRYWVGCIDRMSDEQIE